MRVKIINATAHALHFYKPCDTFWDDKRGWIVKPSATAYLTINASDIIPRCKKVSSEIGAINEIPLRVSEYGDIENLPDAAEGVIYVTSQLVYAAAVKKGRQDIYYPDELVRNEQGVIVGCMALGCGSLWDELSAITKGTN
jgi:hypothetical protein